MSTHELSARDEEAKLPSNRSFGWVMTVAFTVVGLAPLLHKRPFRAWALGVAAVFLVVTLAKPALLQPLNKLWMRFGLLLHHIVSPIILGIVLFVVITPLGMIMRAMGKDPMSRKFDPTVSTYWIPRTPPGPEGASMKNQF
jgi:large-conductance mechanosensitive channel